VEEGFIDKGVLLSLLMEGPIHSEGGGNSTFLK